MGAEPGINTRRVTLGRFGSVASEHGGRDQNNERCDGKPFLAHDFLQREDVVAALLSLGRFRSHIQVEQGACRPAFPRARFVMAGPDLSWGNKKWPANGRGGQRDSGGNKKRRERTRQRPRARLLPWRKENGCRLWSSSGDCPRNPGDRIGSGLRVGPSSAPCGRSHCRNGDCHPARLDPCNHSPDVHRPWGPPWKNR